MGHHQKVPEPQPVYDDPRSWCEPDETGDALDPDTQTVGWSLSFGCNLTVGTVDGRLQVQVSTSDSDQRAGITQRTATSAQVRDYATKLTQLADAWDAAALRRSVGCDRTSLCPAERHAITCLGLYRTEEEMRTAFVPPVVELERRRDNERFHRAYLRAGGPS